MRGLPNLENQTRLFFHQIFLIKKFVPTNTNIINRYVMCDISLKPNRTFVENCQKEWSRIRQANKRENNSVVRNQSPVSWVKAKHPNHRTTTELCFSFAINASVIREHSFVFQKENKRTVFIQGFVPANHLIIWVGYGQPPQFFCFSMSQINNYLKFQCHTLLFKTARFLTAKFVPTNTNVINRYVMHDISLKPSRTFFKNC